MTKRKRTPPPSPKPITFEIPQSLTRLAAQCRELRIQADELVQKQKNDPSTGSNDVALNQAVDAQLNAQLNASLPTPVQQPQAINYFANGSDITAGSSNGGYSMQNHQSMGNAYSSYPNQFMTTGSDEDVRQSVIRDAEQQLGIGSQPDPSHSDPQMQYPSQTGTFNTFPADPQFYDQSSSSYVRGGTQIRFDPYAAPGQPPHYFATHQVPPSPHASPYPNQHFSMPSQPTMNHHNYSNAFSYNQNSSQGAQMLAQSGPYSSSNPFVNIASQAQPMQRPLAPQPQQQQQHIYPSPQHAQPQPGYYRLPPSYWRTPPPLETSAMTEANHRTAALVSAARRKAQDDHGMSTTDDEYSLDMMNDHGGYPDPGLMEVSGDAGEGVFKNLTKERFGRYSVGGKLVGANKEIYG